MLKEIIEGAVEDSAQKELEKVLISLDKAIEKVKKLGSGEGLEEYLESVYIKLEEEIMYVADGEYS